MSFFFRFRKHREKVAKRKQDEEDLAEYHEQHQSIKRRMSESELDNSSISSSPSSFEPMDLSGQPSSRSPSNPGMVEEYNTSPEIPTALSSNPQETWKQTALTPSSTVGAPGPYVPMPCNTVMERELGQRSIIMRVSDVAQDQINQMNKMSDIQMKSMPSVSNNEIKYTTHSSTSWNHQVFMYYIS